MKNKQDLMNISPDDLVLAMKALELGSLVLMRKDSASDSLVLMGKDSASDIFTSINLEDNIVNISDSFFTTFYNTAAYYFNYALEVMTPLAGNICNYFRENTDQYDVDYLNQ